MAKTLDEIKEDVKAIVRSYEPHMDLSQYKNRNDGKLWTDLDQMAEDVWFDVFNDAVTEACEDILDGYCPEEDEDGTR